MNHEDPYLKWKAENGIHEPSFHDNEEPPQGRYLRYGHRSKFAGKPEIKEGEFAHLANRRQSDNARKGWANLTPAQREARAAMNRANANKPKGRKQQH